MAQVVYLLCALTAAACAALLLRGYRRNGVSLLLWAGLCFVGLALNNTATFLDRVVYPQADLWPLRVVPALAGVAALLYGLVWEAT